MKNNETNWATLLREAVASKDNLPPGDGWITARELAVANNFSITKVQRRIVTLMKEGKIERFEGVESGKRNFWYREIKPIKKNKRQLNGVIL